MTNKFKNILFVILGSLLPGLPSLLSLLPYNNLFLKALLMAYYLFIPGLVIGFLLKINYKKTANMIVKVLALSLVFLMLTGYLANEILPHISINRPLDLHPFIVVFNVSLFVAAVFAYKGIRLLERLTRIRKTKISMNFSKENFILVTLSIFSLLLFILGTIVLNNDGSNTLTIIAIFLLIISTFYCLINHKELSIVCLSIFIYSASLGLLLMFSLRSSHVLGFDINNEYHVFQLAQQNGRWSLSKDVNPYNACLSITILPTLLSNLIHISGEYIFKFVYQVIFAFVPLSLFFLYKKLSDIRIALVGSLIFIFQIYFAQQLPALARQEIAFLFLVLVIDCLTTSYSEHRTKLLLYIFSFALIVSHYSTAYFWMFTLLIFYIVYFLFKKFYKRSTLTVSRPSIYYLLIIILGIMLWFGQITTTSSNLTQFITHLPSTFSTLLSSDSLNNDLSKIQFRNSNTNTLQNLNKNFKQTTKEFSNYYNLSPIPNSQNYQPQLTSSITITPKISGFLAGVSNIVSTTIYIAIAYGLELIGMTIVIIKRKKYKKLLLLDMLAFACIPLVVIILLVPSIAVDYNLSRAYMQLLILFAPFAAIALFSLYKIIKFRHAMVATGIILGIFLLYTTGLYNLVFGGSAFINLENFGYDHDKFYTSNAEVYSIKWLQTNYVSKIPVYSDEYGALKIQAYSNINSIRGILYPNLVETNSYVFLDNTNIKEDIAFTNTQNQDIEYAVPLGTLSYSMNTIYVSNNVKILR